MAVDYPALRDLDLTELRDRVAAWTVVTTAMSDAESLYSSDVHAGMASDDWTGTAADHAQSRSGELHGLIAAGATEAAAVRDILTEAVERFGAAQTALTDAVGQVEAIEQLQITDSGKVEFKPGVEAGEPLTVALFSHHIGDLQEQVDAAIDDAQTADDEVAEALRLAAETGDPADDAFNDTALNLGDLERMRTDAAEAAELLDTDPADLDAAALDRLGRLLDDNAEHPVFAEALLSRMGPQGLFTQYGDLVSHTSYEGDAAMVERVERIQRGMGEALAAATNPDNEPDLGTEFRDELMDLAAGHYSATGEPSELAGAFSGYTIIAPLLEHGTYHEDFIVPIAEHMTRIHEYEGLQAEPDDPFTLEDDERSYPLNSAMVALGNNPTAALSYFGGSQEYADLTYRGGYFPGDSATTLDPVGGDRARWALDFAHNGNDATGQYVDRSDVGDALAAAATGRPDGEPTGEPVYRTDDMEQVAESVVGYFGEHPDRLEAGGSLAPMATPMANLTAGYMVDVHNAFTASGGAFDTRVDLPGAQGEFERDHLERLLFSLGQHDEAVDILSGANDAATTVVFAENYVTHGPESGGWVGDAVAPGAKINGLLSAGSVANVIDNGVAADVQHDANVDRVTQGVNLVLDQTPVGRTPVVGTLADGLVNGIGSEFHVDNSVETSGEAQDTLDDMRTDNGNRTLAAVREALISVSGMTEAEANEYIDDSGLNGTSYEGWFQDGHDSVYDWDNLEPRR